MFLFLCILATIIGLKDVLNFKEKKILLFSLFIIGLSIVILVYQDQIPSIMVLIENIKRMFYE